MASSPTVRQRVLGVRLRRIRTDLGLTTDNVATKLLCSPSKISRLETATRRPSLRDIRDLCHVYGVDDGTAADLMELARKSREEEWWTKYEGLNLPYLDLEQAATAITSYTMYYFPALVQTEQYTHAIITGIEPKITPATLKARMEVRRRRQELLEKDKPPRYRVLIDESILRRPVGGRSVMVDQLEKVTELIHQAKVTVQVIPFAIGAHAAQDSNFIVLDFDNLDLSPVAFVEGLTSHQYTERKDHVDRYRQAVDNLRDSALNPRDSLNLIVEAKDTFKDD